MIKEKVWYDLRCWIPSSIYTKIILSALVLYTGHFMIEYSWCWHTFPSYLLTVETNPIELSESLLTIVDSSVNHIVSSIEGRCMVFPDFYAWTWYLYNFPFIFFNVKDRNISIETSILKFLFILWDTSEQDHLFTCLCYGQSMSISWHGQILWNWSNLNPLIFLILIKVRL